jgi:hypothetical protein
MANRNSVNNKRRVNKRRANNNNRSANNNTRANNYNSNVTNYNSNGEEIPDCGGDEFTCEMRRANSKRCKSCKRNSKSTNNRNRLSQMQHLQYLQKIYDTIYKDVLETMPADQLAQNRPNVDLVGMETEIIMKEMGIIQ